MDVGPDERAERRVHLLVPGEASLALEFMRYDERLEVRVVFAEDLHRRVRETTFYEALDLCWIHRPCLASYIGQITIVYYGIPDRGQVESPMFFSLLQVVGGLFLLVWGADRFVHGAAATARKLLTLVYYGLRDGHIRALDRAKAA